MIGVSVSFFEPCRRRVGITAVISFLCLANPFTHDDLAWREKTPGYASRKEGEGISCQVASVDSINSNNQERPSKCMFSPISPFAMHVLGPFVVKRKTSTSRLSRGLKTLSEWCRVNRHQPMREQHRTLSQKLKGALCVLRDHRQLQCAGSLPYRRHLALEALAVTPATAWRTDDLGSPQSLPEALPASASDRAPLKVPSRSDCDMTSQMP